FGFVVVGPACHYWYQVLDRIIPPSKIPTDIVKKLAVDHFIFAPGYLLTFFSAMGLLQGHSSAQIKDKITESYWPTFKLDMAVWIPGLLPYCPLPNQTDLFSFLFSTSNEFRCHSTSL